MEESAEKTSISLFPSHRQIVADFAAQDHRSFSNALQVIIEDWKRMRDAVAEGRMVLLAHRPEDQQPVSTTLVTGHATF